MNKFGDARDNADYGKKRSSMPPRQREGKQFSGGKHMRKQKQKLAVAQQSYVSESPSAKRHKRTFPGSMAL